MDEDAEELDALRTKIGKAASYFKWLIGKGEARLVTLDLFKLGTLGQLVAIELHKRLTQEQTALLEQEMSRQAATDAPRIRQRRVLEDFVKLHDERSCSNNPTA